MAVIQFEDISKQYRLGLVSTRTLSHDLNRWWQTAILRREDPYLKIGETNVRSQKGVSEYVWALRDINLEIKQGEVLGIIGKNGAGKSTLLKILSRITAPTTGIIKAKGCIASLIEIGTGFHPELTGRENIYMNGCILGMTKAEIKRKMDEIVDFAGIERYVDTPVKRYSSGMTVRLGFSVAAHLEPDIMIVDEVLAVGDAEFQKKAIGKMQDVSKGEGRTVLFVSHNMTAVKALCNRGIVLNDGRVQFDGKILNAVDLYLQDDEVKTSEIMENLKYHTNLLEINRIVLNNQTSDFLFLDNKNMSIRVEIEGKLSSSLKVALEARLYDSHSSLLAIYSPCHLCGKTKMYNAGSFKIDETIMLPDNMTKGDYYMEISLTHPNVETLLSLSKLIKVQTEGIVGDSGLSFDYNGCGLLMLYRK